jgi:phospholipid/cholesterol/gamma-HCH transport system ATP-binding protein
MAILLGASGAGKSMILKRIVGLLKPDAGRIWVNGYRIDAMSESELMAVRADIGMVFQEGALFDSMTVGDNVGYRLYEHTDLPPEAVRRRVEEALGLVGLAAYIDRMPSELSGGERRRVAIARAMVSKPRLLLFDEPTTGLDPMTARTVDDEIVKSRDLARATSILVTHQLRDAFYIATHAAVREQQSVRIRPIDERRAFVRAVQRRDRSVIVRSAIRPAAAGCHAEWTRNRPWDQPAVGSDGASNADVRSSGQPDRRRGAVHRRRGHPTRSQPAAARRLTARLLVRRGRRMPYLRMR